ncbi:MAG: hypothetical protein K1Y36_26925 [Blastocatellia bacterium]|nr:hypothetical protein [Blastocatellia bacterium]
MERHEVFLQIPWLPAMELAMDETLNRVVDFLEINPDRRPWLKEKLGQMAQPLWERHTLTKGTLYLKIFVEGDSVSVTEETFGPHS